MSGDMIFSTGTVDGEWEIVEHGGEWVVCKFSNERMRITGDGVYFGGSLRLPEFAQESHRFKTREFAQVMLRFCKRTQEIANSVGRTHITLGASQNYQFYSPQMSPWTCYMFGGKPGQGVSWRPALGEEPNAMWRWAQYLAFGNRWVKE